MSALSRDCPEDLAPAGEAASAGPADGPSTGEAIPPERASAPVPPGVPADTQPCPRCGAEVQAGVGRCPECGTFQPGNDARVTHGARRALDKQPDLVAQVEARVKAIIGHRACDPLYVSQVTDYCRLEVVIASVFGHLARQAGDHMAVSAKGNARAAAKHLEALVSTKSRLGEKLNIDLLEGAAPEANPFKDMSREQLIERLDRLREGLLPKPQVLPAEPVAMSPESKPTPPDVDVAPVHRRLPAPPGEVEGAQPAVLADEHPEPLREPRCKPWNSLTGFLLEE